MLLVCWKECEYEEPARRSQQSVYQNGTNALIDGGGFEAQNRIRKEGEQEGTHLYTMPAPVAASKQVLRRLIMISLRVKVICRMRKERASTPSRNEEARVIQLLVCTVAQGREKERRLKFMRAR